MQIQIAAGISLSLSLSDSPVIFFMLRVGHDYNC